ncbi:hypothetical protein TWF481_011673 [Arthrobotrys musiformis]|uniref:Uncharacterized protein n=1 Tax=Arthrobotrys musiformis TaxID=47236 RepID=A0AAV9VZ45_9PEZI
MDQMKVAARRRAQPSLDSNGSESTPAPVDSGTSISPIPPTNAAMDTDPDPTASGSDNQQYAQLNWSTSIGNPPVLFHNLQPHPTANTVPNFPQEGASSSVNIFQGCDSQIQKYSTAVPALGGPHIADRCTQLQDYSPTELAQSLTHTRPEPQVEPILPDLIEQAILQYLPSQDGGSGLETLQNSEALLAQPPDVSEPIPTIGQLVNEISLDGRTRQQGTAAEIVLVGIKDLFSADPITLVEAGSLPKLSSENFSKWAIAVEGYLREEGLWPTWDSTTKHGNCPNEVSHLLLSTGPLGRYPCNRTLCILRDRVDAMCMLILSLTCQESDRSLIFCQGTFTNAWNSLRNKYDHEGTRNEYRTDYMEFHPVFIMSKFGFPAFQNVKLSAFLSMTLGHWMQYVYMVHHHWKGSPPLAKNLSELHYLKGIFKLLPDIPPYRDVKEYWLMKLETRKPNGDEFNFNDVFGWISLMELPENEFLRSHYGIPEMPGCASGSFWSRD